MSSSLCSLGLLYVDVTSKQAIRRKLSTFLVRPWSWTSGPGINTQLNLLIIILDYLGAPRILSGGTTGSSYHMKICWDTEAGEQSISDSKWCNHLIRIPPPLRSNKWVKLNKRLPEILDHYDDFDVVRYLEFNWMNADRGKLCESVNYVNTVNNTYVKVWTIELWSVSDSDSSLKTLILS